MSRSKLQSKEFVRGDVTSSWMDGGMGQQESDDENTVQLLVLQKKSVVWHKLIGMKTPLRRQIHALFILTSNVKDKVSKRSSDACTACGKHHTHHMCCDSTGLLEISTSASVVNLALLCNKSPGSWINCVHPLRPPLYFVVFCFSFLLKHKAFQDRECLSLHLDRILQNGKLPVVLGPLGSADCNPRVWEGWGLARQARSPQSQFSSGSDTGNLCGSVQ